VSLQRNFLWGGEGSSKVAWVKWTDVCRTKECRGLGLKNLRLVNVSLLTKWWWRLLTSQEMLWAMVLRAKYGRDIHSSSDLSKSGFKFFISLVERCVSIRCDQSRRRW
jgi:hypothetical protein